MAMQVPPPAQGMGPKEYYIELVSQGFSNDAAYQAVNDRYGAPKSPKQRNEDAEKGKMKGELAAAGGMIGGAIATNYVMDNAGKWFDKLTGKQVTEEVAKGIAPPVGGAVTATPGSQAQWNAGADAVSSTPQVISTEGGMSTVQTPVGAQQVPTEALDDPSFWSSIDYGQVAQGGLALYQMYGAYKQFKGGNKVGGGINMAAGAGNLAAATGAVSTGAAAGTTGAYVIPGLNIIAGGYQGYETAKAMGDMAAGSQRTKTGALGGAASGAAIGAGVGSLVPGVGTAIGAGVGAAIGATAGAIGSWTGSSKGKAQFMRDNIRGVLQQNGILDDKFQGTLADGSKVDMGQDGSYLKWKNIDKVSASQPTAWNAAIPAADALAASYGFVGQKASDIAAMYGRAAVSNAKDDPKVALSNMQHFARQQGINLDSVKSKLEEAKADNRISQGQYDYYMSGAQQLLGGAPAGQPATVQRAKKGEVVRQSPGLYRDDKGKLVPAKSMREALTSAYNKTKEKK
jgi:hypothetical protein